MGKKLSIIEAIQDAARQIRDWANEDKVKKVAGKGLSTNDYTTAEKNKVSQMANDLVVLGGKLYLAQDGVPLEHTAVTLPSGGGTGGGGGSTSAAITLTNLLDSNVVTAATGQAANLKFSFTSSETEANGTAYIYVNDVLKMSTSIVSGDNSVDISEHLKDGINEVKLTCMDIYSNSKSLSYSVNVITLRITSSFDATVAYDDVISYPYTAIGDCTKIIHFVLDNTEIDTQEVTTSGRQQTFIIPKKVHGSHIFEVYMTAEIGGETVESNHLYYDLIMITAGETTPIISCVYNNDKIEQYETINISYIVYSPTSLTSNVVLSANEQVVGELVVDRTQQKWSFRADEYGRLALTIACEQTIKTFNLEVSESKINVSAATDNLELYLSSYGRNNNEADPANWSYEDISCSFENYNWASDGWQLDDNGVAVHRVTGNARLVVPLQIFASDFRTTGKTLEFEITTKEVLNYDTVVLSCYSGERGFVITAQQLKIASEQSALSARYKEDEHIRVSIVAEKRSENRLLLCYINGIMSGAVQYPTDDDFSQASPVGITIGSNECTIDIYNIRIYNNSLTRHQIIDNWIADTHDVAERAKRYNRNNIYDAYGRVVMSQLPDDLPYLVLQASELPQFKGDKKPCSGYFVDPLYSERNFSFTNAQNDVQGTSSQYYYSKNYKIKFNNGFVLYDNSEEDVYKISDDAVPVNVFTMKADVASSEGAFNVVLAMLYDDLCPFKTPAQEADERIRQCIEGFPIVIFWDNGTEVEFLGKYNFNNDKGTPEVFGFQDGDESWEILQNGTDRVGWHSADFSGEDWKNDFEARYPEDNVDTTRLQALAEWLCSTDTEQATGEEIVPVTYDGVEYTTDTSEYRLAKFSAELSEHFIEEAIIFYYLFTELFLCIDQREKNAFPTYIKSLNRWIILFYDADSSIGTDNKGNMTFEPYFEDIDYTEGGDPIYNGQNSVLWKNLRITRYDAIMEMYRQMRVDGLISYDIVSGKFEAHQDTWPAAIFNEDMYKKCLEPLILSGDGMYLPMLQGKKEQWIKWWLYNRFRYLDTKYITGTSETNKMIIRAKSKANVTLTSYINMYGHVYYNAEMVEHRMERGQPYEFVWTATGAEDAVIGINDADMLTSLGDLSPHMVEQIDTSLATHITSLKLGDNSEGYVNYSLKSLTLGNNTMLRVLDVRSCPNLTQTVDVSGCTNIEEAYFEGSSIAGVTLPDGGILKLLHLPDTVTNLTIRNQPLLSDFVLNDSTNITTLRLENVGAFIDTPTIIHGMVDGGRIRALDIDWEIDSESDLVALLNKLIKMRGLDENGNNTNSAVLTGRIRVNEKVSDEVVGEFYNYFTDVVIDDGSSEIYIINYKDWDGTVLYTDRLTEGEDAIDPIEIGLIDEPFRERDENYSYEFAGWNIIPTNVLRHYQIIATYRTMVAINYAVDGVIKYSDYVVYGSNAEDPVTSGKMETPTKEGTDVLRYIFVGWDGSLLNITLPRTINALFSNVHPVHYKTPDTTHYTQWIIEGQDAYDPITANECDIPDDIVTENEKKLVFSSWENLPTNITGVVEVNATYDTYWAARFLNDGKLYLLEWVLEGATVIEPEDYIENYEEPTRESTAQYHYVFSKWLGDWESIMEPRDFTAEYVANTRTYDVYFYNTPSDEEPLAVMRGVYYGTTVEYAGETPIKQNVHNPEEYAHVGWTPSIDEVITGETYYYALFKYTGYLFGKLAKPEEEDQGYGTVDNPNWDAINAYWSTINDDIDAYKGGILSEEDFFTKYPIGGRMLIPINLSNSTTVIDLEIIGHNHDDLTDGSGKAPLTFFCVDLPNTKHMMNNNSVGGWTVSKMRSFTNGELFEGFPEELKNVIKYVDKISDKGQDSTELTTTTDRVWLASTDEVGLHGGHNALLGQGTCYDQVFINDDSRIKLVVDSASPNVWWLRSSNSASNLFVQVTAAGRVYSYFPTHPLHFAFGFCL